MAEELGLSHTGYHRYESEASQGSKQRFLPMDLARRIAAVLADRGVNPDDVLTLAGIGIDEASSPQLSAGEQQLIDRFRHLDAAQRRLLLQLAEQMDRDIPAPAPKADTGATVHAPRASFHAQGDSR